MDLAKVKLLDLINQSKKCNDSLSFCVFFIVLFLLSFFLEPHRENVQMKAVSQNAHNFSQVHEIKFDLTFA